MNDNDKPSTTRRNVLRASVGGAAVPLSIGTVAGQQKELPVVTHHRGTWKVPLDVDQMMQVKRAAVKEHVARGGRAPGEYVNAVPDFPDHAKLVDYVVGVKPDGTPTQHVGIVGHPDSVASVHEDATEKRADVRKKARGERP